MNTALLFGRLQHEIASLITNRLLACDSARIVTGFATPGGLNAIKGPVASRPSILRTFVVGSGTYPAYEVLDEFVRLGVPQFHLRVHLGHTALSAGRRNPFVRYHPMLHSKIYYMEMPEDQACAFVGSHNLTSFALRGLNAEASVMLEGPRQRREFDAIRRHIDEAESQAAIYDTAMKPAYVWWFRQFLDGLCVELRQPRGATTVRTILIFAQAGPSLRPQNDDTIYFELPSGIQRIESLQTEVHLFLFDVLPGSASEALAMASTAATKLKCVVLGVENAQGNLEVEVDWRIASSPTAVLQRVPSGSFRPACAAGMQQVRARVVAQKLEAFEYFFENENTVWSPKFSRETQPIAPEYVPPLDKDQLEVDFAEPPSGWQLVAGLVEQDKMHGEKDAAALLKATPASGSFVLVSLRRATQKKGRRDDR